VTSLNGASRRRSESFAFATEKAGRFAGNAHGSVTRRANYKAASPELMQRIARELDLPDDYFREVREAFVIDRIKRDAALRDSLYERLRRGG
jgi:hypothetical protein